MDETYVKLKGKWKYFYRAVDKAGKTIDFLLTAKRDKAAARRFFEKAIGQNGSPETVTIDKSGANLAALHAVNAERETPITIRQVKYLNNVVEVRHEVAYRSCSHFSRYRRSEPPVSPGESRSLNQERLRQRNEAPQGAGYQSREAYPSGSHTPDECQIVGMVKTFESAIGSLR